MEEYIKRAIATILSTDHTELLAKTRNDCQIVTQKVPIQIPKASRYSEMMKYIKNLENPRYDYLETGQSLLLFDHTEKEMYLIVSTTTIASCINAFKAGKISYISSLIILTNYYKSLSSNQAEFTLESTEGNDYKQEVIEEADKKISRLLREFSRGNLLEYGLQIVTRDTSPDYTSEITVQRYSEQMQVIEESNWGVLIDPEYALYNSKNHSSGESDNEEGVNDKPKGLVKIRQDDKEVDKEE